MSQIQKIKMEIRYIFLEAEMVKKKYVFFFEDGNIRGLLGAGLAETRNVGIPVPLFQKRHSSRSVVSNIFKPIFLETWSEIKRVDCYISFNFFGYYNKSPPFLFYIYNL